MQGQKGAIGSLPESLPFEHGSTSSDSEQQICWTNFNRNPPVDLNQETPNLSMWSMGESSSSSMPNPKSRFSLADVNNNLSDTHVNNGHHHHGHNVNVDPSTYIGKKPSNHASSSSGPVEMEARQFPCKRKAAELSIGQSSSGIESSHSFQRPEGSNSMWHSAPENPTPTNTISFGAVENIHRNVRVRTNNSSPEDQVPSSNSISNNNGLLSFSSQYPSLGLNPVRTTGDGSSSHAGQPMLRVPRLTRNLHVSSRSSSISGANRPISSNIIGGSGDNLMTTPTSISDHPLFVQPRDIRNTTQTAVNWDLNFIGGNGNEANNGNGIASTSNPVPNLGSHRGSSLYSSRRHTELLQRSLLSSTDTGAAMGGGWQNSNLFSRIPPPVNAPSSSSQETGIPSVIAITGHPHHHRARTSDRLLNGAFGFPYQSRTFAGGRERRGRLVSEMRNVLDRIRRGEGLRFEDVVILDPSVLYGMPDVHDRHRDMRLDIDNMSYEELLALEERIGNVNTGLTEENIYKHLKQKTYVSVAGQPDAEPCCICQEEYKNGDDMGALDCGHDFHTGCIKQWLLQKNLCPVCKSAALK